MWSYNYDYLEHHGILGQKWGVRRFQNADGSLTAAGKKRYRAENVESISSAKGIQRRLNDLDEARVRNIERVRDKDLARNVYADRADKALQSGNKEKFQKNINKSLKESDLLEKFANYYFEGEKEIDRLLSKIDKEGYDVSAWPVPRYPSTILGPDRLGFHYTVKDKNNVGKLMETAGSAEKYPEFKKTVLQNKELKQFIKDHPQPGYDATEKEHLKANKEFKDDAKDLVYKVYGKDISERTTSSDAIYNPTLATRIVDAMYDEALTKAYKK